MHATVCAFTIHINKLTGNQNISTLSTCRKLFRISVQANQLVKKLTKMGPKLPLKVAFYKWVKELDTTERSHFQLDGKSVFCNVSK
jgi:hypothetical protein